MGVASVGETRKDGGASSPAAPCFFRDAGVAGQFRASFPVRELCLPRRWFMSNPERTVRKNRRANPRRAPKGSTRVTCRRGSLGLGPNLALSLLDVSETGARLLVKEPL